MNVKTIISLMLFMFMGMIITFTVKLKAVDVVREGVRMHNDSYRQNNMRYHLHRDLGGK